MSSIPRPGAAVTVRAPETISEWAASVRQARADLMTVPAMPVTAVPADPDVLCVSCDMPPELPRMFADADGWVWCARCAASDVIGAALTRGEADELYGWLARAVARASRRAAGSADPCGTSPVVWAQVAGEARELRDLMLPAFASPHAAVPNPFPAWFAA